MEKRGIDEALADALGHLAHIIHNEVGWEPEGTFLYAEFEPGVVAAGLYQEPSDRVICHEPGDTLFAALSDLWYQADPDKRWRSLRYTLVGGKFEASVEYPDQWDGSESYHDRLARIRALKYGAKPIEYAPLPGMDV